VQRCDGRWKSWWNKITSEQRGGWGSGSCWCTGRNGIGQFGD
jgi:hypothetical protein